MPRPHAKHHDGLYPTYPKLPNIFRGQVNVWKQPRDLGGIQDLILSWKQAASNINLIQYKCSTLEKNKWWQMWRYALVGSRRLGSWTKSIRRHNKKRKQTTHPEGCRSAQHSSVSRYAGFKWPLPDPSNLAPWQYHATKPPAKSNRTPFKFARCLSRRARREYKFQQWGDKSLHDPRLEAHDRPWDKGIRSGKGLKTLPRPRHSSPAVFMLQIAHSACFPITKTHFEIHVAQNDFPPGLFDLLSSWLYTDQDYLNCMVLHRKFHLPTDFHLCNRTSSANPRGPKQKIRPKQKMAAPQIWWTGFSDTWIKLKHSKTFANKKLLQYFWDCKTPEVIPNLSHKLTWWDCKSLQCLCPVFEKTWPCTSKSPCQTATERTWDHEWWHSKALPAKVGEHQTSYHSFQNARILCLHPKKDFHFWKRKASACVSATWCKFGCRSVSKLCATFTKGAPSCAAAGRRV